MREKYAELSKMYNKPDADVAVRSSSTAEDLPDASFAGQQDTYLGVRGEEHVLDSVRACFGSLFTDRAISYRKSMGFDHLKVWLSVAIQKMVRSDIGSSGVAFSLDTDSGFKDIVLINGSVGLGEMVVQGAVSPDEFIVFKPLQKKGLKPLIDKKLGMKDKKMIYSDDLAEKVKIVPTTQEELDTFCIDEEMALKLAGWVTRIEEHYSEKYSRWCPMDTEWAVDGETGELFIVQARPETVVSRMKTGVLSSYKLKGEITSDPLT